MMDTNNMQLPTLKEALESLVRNEETGTYETTKDGKRKWSGFNTIVIKKVQEAIPNGWEDVKRTIRMINMDVLTGASITMDGSKTGPFLMSTLGIKADAKLTLEELMEKLYKYLEGKSLGDFDDAFRSLLHMCQSQHRHLVDGKVLTLTVALAHILCIYEDASTASVSGKKTLNMVKEIVKSKKYTSILERVHEIRNPKKNAQKKAKGEPKRKAKGGRTKKSRRERGGANTVELSSIRAALKEAIGAEGADEELAQRMKKLYGMTTMEHYKSDAAMLLKEAGYDMGKLKAKTEKAKKAAAEKREAKKHAKKQGTADAAAVGEKRQNEDSEPVEAPGPAQGSSKGARRGLNKFRPKKVQKLDEPADAAGMVALHSLNTRSNTRTNLHFCEVEEEQKKAIQRVHAPGQNAETPVTQPVEKQPADTQEYQYLSDNNEGDPDEDKADSGSEAGSGSEGDSDDDESGSGNGAGSGSEGDSDEGSGSDEEPGSDED